MSTQAVRDLARAERRWVAIAVVAVALLAVVQIAGAVVREAVTDDPSRLELVQTCLTERSVPFEQVTSDPIALSTSRGALRTMVEGNPVTVVLAGSEDEARRVYENYVAVSPDEALPRLEQRRKVVFLWDSPPSPTQREFMYLCTLDAQE